MITSVGSIVVARMQRKNALSHHGLYFAKAYPVAALTTTVSSGRGDRHEAGVEEVAPKIEPRPRGARSPRASSLSGTSVSGSENSSLPGLNELSRNHSSGNAKDQDQQPQDRGQREDTEQRSSRRPSFLEPHLDRLRSPSGSP